MYSSSISGASVLSVDSACSCSSSCCLHVQLRLTLRTADELGLTSNQSQHHTRPSLNNWSPQTNTISSQTTQYVTLIFWYILCYKTISPAAASQISGQHHDDVQQELLHLKVLLLEGQLEVPHHRIMALHWGATDVWGSFTAADHDQCSLITHTYARDRWWTAWDAWRSRSPETHRWELLQRKSVWGWWWGWWWGWRLTIRGAPGFSAIRDSSTSRSFLSWRSWWRKPFRSRWRNESFRDLQHTESIMGTRVRSTLMLSSQSQESAVFIAHVSPVTVMQRTTAFNSCWL